ncbi:MAG: thioredoxin domain-containing protein [Betaproteobacteria bacterium]|nr:thioredoxin domain-containing protein [Betaproteobacteria bacterium]
MKTALIITALLFGFTAFAVSMLLKHAKPEAPAEPMPTRDKLVRAHSPAQGDASAPVVIVEFLDPACGTCRDFHPMVKTLLAEHPGKIKLVVRYAPFHQGADRVVAMLHAAHLQRKFWPALDALFNSHGEWVVAHRVDPERAWKVLSGAGLNMDQLAVDLSSPETAAVVQQDLADASALQVAKTPAFFVNGRPLEPFGWEPLRKLVRDEVGRAVAQR